MEYTNVSLKKLRISPELFERGKIKNLYEFGRYAVIEFQPTWAVVSTTPELSWFVPYVDDQALQNVTTLEGAILRALVIARSIDRDEDGHWINGVVQSCLRIIGKEY